MRSVLLYEASQVRRKYCRHMEDITFFLEGDAFDNSTGVTVSASVQTGSTDAPEELVTVDFQGGERFPLGTDERDPCYHGG